MCPEEFTLVDFIVSGIIYFLIFAVVIGIAGELK